MSATTAQTVQHKPWCTDHIEAQDEHDPTHPGWCRHAFWTGGIWDTGEPEKWVTLMTEEGETFLEVTPQTRNYVTAAEARTIAAALLEAADVLEAAS